jgi:hypothetical protein
MNRNQKEALKERIEKLDPQEHAQIFEVIKRYTDSFTKTQNGVLVSSDALSNECLVEIDRLVTFYIDQRKRMDTDDRRLAEHNVALRRNQGAQ